MSPLDHEPSKAWLAERLAHIEGWTFPDEAWALYLSAKCFLGTSPPTVVEIGSWKGRSTIALALGVRDRGAGRVYAIDPHTGNREYVEAHGPVDTFDTFLRNIQEAGVAEFVEPIRSTSHSARARFREGSVNVLFVDGSHEYSDVARDVKDWTPALSDAAVVGFNDPIAPGVYKALCQLVMTMPSAYRNPRYIANTLFFEFQSSRPWRFVDYASALRLRLLLFVRSRAQAPSSHLPPWAVGWGRRLYNCLLP